MLHQLRLALSPVFSFRREDPFSLGKVALIAAVLLGLIWGWPHGTAHGSKTFPPPVLNLKDGTALIPESERSLDVCVIGLDPSRGLFCFLPFLQLEASAPAKEFEEIHRQLYWLNFEISHGRLLNALPKRTQIFVALPDPQSVKQADGKEEGLFRDYLKTHCGWTEAEIQGRIHFFKTPVPVVWIQDIGKILGHDAQGRWIICRSSNDQTGYRESVGALCRAFPDRFTYRDLPAGVSAEGGDEDLVRTPEGNLALLVGRHRASHYLEWSGGRSLNDQVLTQDDLVKAEDLFSGAFNGLPVVFIPSRVLENPSLGNNELFHLDMSVAVLSVGGKTHAFVPSYTDHPVDRVTGMPLDPAFVKSLQNEYDLMASELSSLGYPVDRLAVTDHPVRSPANLVRYYDPATGRCTVLLAKYPYNLPGTGGPSPQEKLMESFKDIREKGEAWEKTPGGSNFRRLLRSIENAWWTMDWASSQEDPFFEQNREIFQKAGIDVVAVPDFAWGSGGLHCQVLH
jgi:hypothetical protein